MDLRHCLRVSLWDVDALAKISDEPFNQLNLWLPDG